MITLMKQKKQKKQKIANETNIFFWILSVFEHSFVYL